MARKARRKGDTILVEALARGQSVAQAARLAGISKRTAFRRLEEPAFQDEVRKTVAEFWTAQAVPWLRL